ncbi:hypothetical protein [Dyella sp. A6]|uniref:hypothetical protein n=1 Tax=Dyella aluminiiresistens TaxID=3069105 RepID=UPI002E781B22|nr:hypothetical protein [Dyella sp. A6]
MVIIDLALLLGVLTPVVSMATGALAVTAFFDGGHGRWPQELLILLLAVSLLLVGPGAFSLDALMYGRRRLVPHRHDD